MSQTLQSPRRHRCVVAGLTRSDIKNLRSVLANMLARCYKPERDMYPYYGGRGIAVCDEWRNSNSLPFIQWAAESGYRPGLEIDRRDVNGNYDPANCRWVTRQQNTTNRRHRRNSALRFKGIAFVAGRKKPWKATLCLRGKRISLGYWATDEDAARAYDAAAIEHFGEFACLNFPRRAAQ